VTGSLCAVVLAAGEGRRLRPLTERVPKPLCPVGNVALLDRTLARLARHGLGGPALVAVNASYLADQIEAHVGSRAQVRVEPGGPLGTAGGVANLRDWIAGRGVLVGNSDAYLGPAAGDLRRDLAALLDGWDGERVRILTVPARPDQWVEFRGPGGPQVSAGFSLLPWSVVQTLRAEPTDLVREAWRPAEAAGRLELIPYPGRYFDSGTVRDYLEANLHAAAGGNLIAVDATVTGSVERAVIGAGARVEGKLSRAVVWPGGYVGPDETLTDAIRVGTALTVPAHG
jgi:NDP-sugar pyrophosphorylase family protein